MKFLRYLWGFVLDILFPRGCVHCGSELKTKNERTYGVCRKCFDKIPTFSELICPTCSRRLAGVSERCHSSPLSALFSVTKYSNAVLRDIIHSAKYSCSGSSLRALSFILRASLREADFSTFIARSRTSERRTRTVGTVIVPVPLHFLRENKRGFNQAEILSRSVYDFLKGRCSDLNISHEPKLLKRIKATKSQSEIHDHKEREGNLQGAFIVREKFLPTHLFNVILVDDVYTSGATMREAARGLKEAGAKKIVGVVVARA